MRPSADPLAVSIKTATELTGLRRSTIYKLIGDGQLDAFKVGAATRITTKSIRELIANAPRKTAA